MKNYSLRNRLIARITLPILITTLLVMAFSYASARHEIEEVYDAQLVHSAKVLLQLTQHEIIEDEAFDLGIEKIDLQHSYERNLGFRIWSKDKLIAQATINANLFSGLEVDPGFSNHVISDQTWRFYVYIDPVTQIRIEVSEHYDIRYELIFELMLSLVMPALIALPIIFAIIWGAVSQVLKPLVSISTDVNARSSDDLSPLPQDNIPEEVAPLIRALNALFERIEQSFKREREFTDHAAHELRTPLAAMKTQTQVLMRKAAQMPDCAEGLNNLQASIERSIHLVEQLLALARLQNEDLEKSDFNLSHLLEDLLRERAHEIAKKSMTLNQNIASDFHVCGNEYAVSIMLNNILGNALKYTPQGGTLNVTLTADGGLSIADTGIGISNADKQKVFERFVRADKTGQSGSGLGLPIAKWIADVHDLHIELADNQPQGLIVNINWNGK